MFDTKQVVEIGGKGFAKSCAFLDFIGVKNIFANIDSACKHCHFGSSQG